MIDTIGETLEDIVITPAHYTIAGVSVSLGLAEQTWDDGSWLFCGYQSTSPADITLAGKPVKLQIEIFPEGTPERTNPFLPSLSAGENIVTWYENALVTLADAMAFLREFEQKRGFLLDGTLNSEIEKHYNHKDFQSQFQNFVAIIEDKEMPFPRKLERLAPILTSLRRIIENNRIPDELKYEESLFYLNLLKLQQHVQRLLEEIGKAGDEILPDFKLIAEHLADVIEFCSEDHQNVARGREPATTPEEKGHILHTLEELAYIISRPKGSLEARESTGRHIALCQQIWRNTLVDWQTRLDCATDAVETISDAISQTETAAIARKKYHARIPDLSRYIDEINAGLAELEKIGLPAISNPVAGKFLSSVNERRQNLGQKALSRDNLAANLQLTHLLVSLTEKNSQLDTTFHLSLFDERHPLAGHMHVILRNGKILDMQRLGR